MPTSRKRSPGNPVPNGSQSLTAVLNRIRLEPGESRFDLARATGLSPAAITGLTERLLREGLIVEEKPSLGPLVKRGRRPTALRINARARLVAGVEISPDSASIALADLNGAIIEEHVVPAAARPAAFIDRIARALAELPGPVAGAGVSIPGNLAPSGEVVAATNLHWKHVRALGHLREKVTFPVDWDNNSNLSALAERWFAPRDTPADFVFVTLRTGLGTGIFCGGHLVRGASGRAGEFGHTTLIAGGRRCVCGRRGCWEEYASDRAAARTSVKVAARYLGLGIADLILALNPAAVIVDDYAAAHWPSVGPVIERTLAKTLPAHWLEGVEVRPARHSAHSSLMGAVALALHRFFTGRAA